MDEPPYEEQLRTLHKTLKAVTHDIQRLYFNTAIARMMEFVNFFTRQTQRPRDGDGVLCPAVLAATLRTSPILSNLLGHHPGLSTTGGPVSTSAHALRDIRIPVQVKATRRYVVSRRSPGCMR